MSMPQKSNIYSRSGNAERYVQRQTLVLRNIVNHNMPLLSIPAEPGDVILCRVAGSPEQVGLVNIVQDYGETDF